MKRLIKIEKFLPGNKINLYSIKFVDENGNEDRFNETQKFFSSIKNSHPEDYQIFKAVLKNILEISGAKPKFFRNEDNADCNFLKALVNNDIGNKKYKGELRLFCLHYSNERVIFGNGGVKKTRTFNEDIDLYGKARILQALDKQLNEKECEGEVLWDKLELKSTTNLIFEIET